jgi:IclR family pca regulon transcriptional regulator
LSTDHVQSLERGLRVITVFSRERPRLTLTDVARHAGFTRATARRLLITLESLGYARSDGKYFELTAKVLELGFAYLSSLDLNEVAQRDMQELGEITGESCSAAVLDDAEIVYVARVPTKRSRIMAVSLGIGSRLPAFCTSLGRVLLAAQPEERVRELLGAAPLPRFTPRTIVDLDDLIAELATVRAQGWALVDQEREIGVRSIAAPLRDRSGAVVAALNVSCNPAHIDLETLRGTLLPALLNTATTISHQLASRP